MKIFLTPKWVLPFGHGLTLYKYIFVRKDSPSVSYIIAHEEEHVRQWTSIGFFKFPMSYLFELCKNGYQNNKYEIQARSVGWKNHLKYSQYDLDT